MRINRWLTAIDQACLSEYKDLYIINSDKKGVINDYFHKMIYSIARLQGKSSEVVRSNIQCNYRGVFSSNITTTSGISSFRTIFSTTSYSNKINHQKGSFLFVITTHRKQWFLMRHSLQYQFPVLSFLRFFLFIYLKKTRFRKVLDF